MCGYTLGPRLVTERGLTVDDPVVKIPLLLRGPVGSASSEECPPHVTKKDAKAGAWSPQAMSYIACVSLTTANTSDQSRR